jgi:hypothetical protein
MSLALAERTAHGNAWASYESALNERDALEDMEVAKYEEINADAELMDEAMTHLYLSSEDNRWLVMTTRFAVKTAVISGKTEAIQEAAVGLSDLQDKAAAMYAKHLVSRQAKN